MISDRPALPADFAADAVAAIRARLAEAEKSGANVLLAIESGSRAWGFPSPDSDYDCRFLYARCQRDHVVLNQARDVVEFPILGDIDVGGWDLRKALLLALGGIAVVVEWTTSPLTYEEAPGFRGRLFSLLAEIVDPIKVSRHYLGLARSHLQKTGNLSGNVKLKKLFYLIRPLVALDWMNQHDFKSLPPMNMIECMAEARLSTDATEAIERLIETKRQTREMGGGPVPAALARYLEARYGFHEMNARPVEHDEARQKSRYQAAEEFYRREVERLAE